jgi:hypothetical protein
MGLRSWESIDDPESGSWPLECVFTLPIFDELRADREPRMVMPMSAE